MKLRDLHIRLLTASLSAIAGFALLSCFDDPAGPSAPYTGLFAVAPTVEGRAAGILPIAEIHLTLHRPGQSTGVIDTVIVPTAGADSVSIVLTVPMLQEGETFDLFVAMLDELGDTLFVAGPVPVVPSTTSDAVPIATPTLTYVGPGAHAVGVRILTADTTAFFGETLTLVAEAFDAAGDPVLEAPIGWISLDTTRVRLPDARVGSAVAATNRGSADVVAFLLSGPEDTVRVLVQPVPEAVTSVTGDAQTAVVGTALTDSLVARVTASDGLGVAGILVHFRSAFGTLSPESVLTDTTGRAAAAWTLGPVPGDYQAVADVPALADSVAFAATATVGAVASVQLTPATATLTALGQTVQLSADVRDALGNVVAGAPVTWSPADPSVATVSAGGLVTAVSPGTASVVAASGAATDTATVTVSQVPTLLGFAVQPVNTIAGAAISPAVAVAVRDALGNPVTGATDAVTMAIGANPSSGTLSGTATVSAVSGVATFADLGIDNIGTGYTLTATSGSLTAATSTAFDVTARAGIVAWIGTADGNWSDGANWNTGAPPTSADSVIIAQNGTYTVTLDASATVADLAVGATTGTQTLDLGTSTLTIPTNSLTIGANAVLQMAGGTLAGGGTTSVFGTFDWTGGTLTDAGTTRIEAGGVLNLASGTKTLTGGHHVENAGTATWTAGDIESGNGATFSNEAGGTIDLQGDVRFNHSLGGATPTFTNAGALTRSVGAGIAAIFGTFDNAGTVAIQSGTLQLSGGGTSSGTFQIEAGARLSISGQTLDATSVVAGAGRVYIGSTDVNGTYAVSWTQVGAYAGPARFNATAPASTTDTLIVSLLGRIGGTGELQVSDRLEWTGGTFEEPGTTTLLASGTLLIGDDGGSNWLLGGHTITNRGSAVWTASDIGVQGGTLLNGVGATFEVQGDVSFVYYASVEPSVFTNAGTLTRTTGTGVATLDMPFDNAGLVAVQSGTLALARGGTATGGTFQVDTDAVLAFTGGTHALDAASVVMGSGRVRFAGGTVDIDGGYGITGSTEKTGGITNFNSTAFVSTTDTLLVSFGTLGGTGSLNVLDYLDWTGGILTGTGTTQVVDTATLALAGGTKTLTGGRVLWNLGTATWTVGDIWSGNGATFLNGAAGTVDVQGDVQLLYNQGGATPIFTNNGTLTRTGGTGVATLDAQLDNAGLVSVQSGTLALSRGGTGTGGTFQVDTAAVLAFTGGTHALDAASVIMGSGRVQFAGGLVDINGGYGITETTEIAGGTANFLNTVSAARTDTLLVSAGTRAGRGLLEVYDHFEWTGGTLTDSGTTTVFDAATFTLAGGTKTLTGAHRIDNLGTATWSAGDIWSGNGATFNNMTPRTFLATGDNLQFVYNQGGDIPTFINDGVFDRTTGTGAVTIDVAFNNLYFTRVQTGTLSLTRGGVSTNGGFQVDSLATLEFGGGTHSLDLYSSITSAGTVRFSAGLVDMNGPYTVTERTEITGGTANFHDPLQPTTTDTLLLSAGARGGIGYLNVVDHFAWTGGTITDVGTTTILSSATFDLAGGIKTLSGAHNVRNAGAATWSAGDIQSGTGGVFVNEAGAGLTVQAPVRFAYALGGTVPLWQNWGTLSVDAGGALAVEGQFEDALGALLGGNGTIDLSGATVVRDSVFADVSGGVPVTDPGAFAIVGDWTQSEAATLTVQMAGATAGAYDRLDVTGVATLAGTMTAELVEPYVPVHGDTLVVLAADSIQGRFASMTLPDIAPLLWNVVWADTPGADSLYLIVYDPFQGAPAGTEAVWTGSVSPDWHTAGNWHNGIVPDDTTSAFVRADAPNQPEVGTYAAVDTLVLQTGASATVLEAGEIAVFGDLDAGYNSIGGLGRITLNASNTTVRGSVPNLTVYFRSAAADSVIVNGDLWLAGEVPELTLNGNTVRVTGNLYSSGNPGLNMSAAADTLIVEGDATFDYAYSSAVLSDGVLIVQGAFTVGLGPSSFAPFGNHKTVLSGALPQVITFSAPDDTLNRFRHLEIAGDAQVTVDSSIAVSGDLTVVDNATLALGPGDVGGLLVQVTGRMATAGLGTLVMTQPTATLEVNGDVTFDGGSTAGLLTGGTLLAHGNFTQLNTASDQSYAADPSHVTQLSGGTVTQRISFATPDSVAGSHFGSLDVSPQYSGLGGDTLQFDTRAVALGAVTLDDNNGDFPLVLTGLGELVALGDITHTTSGAGIDYAVNAVRLGGTLNLTGSTLFTPDTTEFFGAGQVISALDTLTYRSIVVSGDSARLTAVTAHGDLIVRGAGYARIDTTTVNVRGHFRTDGAATLEMNEFGTLNVDSNVTFAGGSTATTLTGGTLNVGGDFTQSAATSAQSFAASGAFQVQFIGNGLQTVSFATPDTAAGSHFAYGYARQTDPGILRLATDVHVTTLFNINDFYTSAAAVTLDGPGELIVAGDVQQWSDGWGSSVENAAVRLGGVLTIQSVFQPDTTEFFGTGQQMTYGTAYRTVVITGDSVLSPPTGAEVQGDVIVRGNGLLHDAGYDWTIRGNLATQDNGVLRMDSPNSALSVFGNVTFGGGSTAGRITNGTMLVGGSFAQLGDPASFSASGTHVTMFVGDTASSTVAFANPGFGAAASHFQDLRLGPDTLSYGATLATRVFAEGRLIRVLGDSAFLVGTGDSLTVRGLEAQFVTFDAVPLVVVDGAPFTWFDLNVFRNMSDAQPQFRVVRSSGYYGAIYNTFDDPGPGVDVHIIDTDGGSDLFLGLCFPVGNPLIVGENTATWTTTACG